VKCVICQEPTSEHLVLGLAERRFLFFRWKDWNSVPVCREHLIAWFRAEFLDSTQRMVVFYPNLEEKHGNYQYYYARLEEIRKRTALDERANDRVLQLVKGWLGMVHGQCEECAADGQVAYFTRGSLRWQRVPGWAAGLYDFPMIEDVKSRPNILCRACAFKHIEQSLRNSDTGFEEGVFCPNKDEEGVYLTGQV
jgi:hypothetical protein